MNIERIKPMVGKSKMDYARELNKIYNAYEVRPNSVRTTYSKMFFDKERASWRIIGYAHDYSIYIN